MAVQIPDPGTGNGQTGDNEYVFRKKVKDNFSDQTNAASRPVGASKGSVPLAEQAHKAVFSQVDAVYTSTGVDCDTFAQGTVYCVAASGNTNAPPFSGSNYWLIRTMASLNASTTIQVAIGYTSGDIATRVRFSSDYTAWKSPASVGAYENTTATGANTVVDSKGNLMRSTSSERYKDILAPLELDDSRYADAMALKPIVYRSTADADNPAYHYYSFSAEELGAYDPAFTLWRETETVTGADGNVTEQPLAERQAEGININALLAMSHAIAIKQDKIIKALEARIEILEAK